MILKTSFAAVALITSLISVSAHAWGRRGHAIVCETAANLLAKDAVVFEKHSFDLGYYCNVPDLVWKKPATYAVEAPQHFMDLEIFSRALPKSGEKTSPDPFALTRAEFEKQYPSIPVSAGRSFWRIQELVAEMSDLAKTLKASPLNKDAQFKNQEAWLVRAGAVGHYVGDLSQPLHVTEDYDGQKEDQKGIHAFFEDQVVDEIYTSGLAKLESDVGTIASKKWKSSAYKTESTLEIIEALAKESNSKRAELLRIDKKTGRKDVSKAAHAFEPLVKEQLAEGALALAALWRRESDWTYNGDKFYNFAGSPEYVYPPGTSASDFSPSALLKEKKRPEPTSSAAPAGPTPAP